MSKKYEPIKQEFIQSNVSLRELAEKHGVSYSTLRKVASAENWTEKRNSVVAKAEQKLLAKTADKRAQDGLTVYSVAAKLLKKAMTIADGNLNAKQLHELTGALKDIKDITGVMSAEDAERKRLELDKLRKEVESSGSGADDSIVVVMPPELDELEEELPCDS